MPFCWFCHEAAQINEVLQWCLTMYRLKMSQCMTKWPMHPAKTQISLGIHPVWSAPSLPAWTNIWSLATHWAHNGDWLECMDVQADLSLRWVHTSFCWFCCAAAQLSKKKSHFAHYLDTFLHDCCWRCQLCTVTMETIKVSFIACLKSKKFRPWK